MPGGQGSPGAQVFDIWSKFIVFGWRDFGRRQKREELEEGGQVTSTRLLLEEALVVQRRGPDGGFGPGPQRSSQESL